MSPLTGGDFLYPEEELFTIPLLIDISAPYDTARLFLDFPEDIRLYGLSFNTNIGDWAFSGEYGFRPNQPLQVLQSECPGRWQLKWWGFRTASCYRFHSATPLVFVPARGWWRGVVSHRSLSATRCLAV